MRGAERFFTLGAFVYMAVYVPGFLVLAWRNEGEPLPALILPFHLLCMLLNLVALVLTIRDLYLRKFDSENAKLTWLLLILWTMPVGWLVYVFRHAVKPRARPAGDAREEAGGEGSGRSAGRGPLAPAPDVPRETPAGPRGGRAWRSARNAGRRWA